MRKCPETGSATGIILCALILLGDGGETFGAQEEKLLLKWNAIPELETSFVNAANGSYRATIRDVQLADDGKSRALAFNGSTAHVRVAESPELNARETLRVELAFSVSKPVKPGTCCLVSQEGRFSITLQCAAGAITGLFASATNEAGKTVAVRNDPAGATLFPDTWYQTVLVMDHENMTLHINGKAQTATQAPFPLNIATGKGDLFVGSLDGKQDFFKGSIKDLSIASFVPSRAAAIIKVDQTARTAAFKGDFDSPFWSNTGSIGGFLLLNRQGAPAKEQTTVRFAHDSQRLYFAFRCQEPKIENLVSDAPSWWKTDCIEIFLDTQRDRKTYCHFAVNIAGKKYFAKVLSVDEREEQDTTDIETLVSKGKDYWLAEVAIPFSKLKAGAADGATWGASLNREEKGLGENSGWPNGNFNLPKAFGTLVFNSYARSIQAQGLDLRGRIEKLRAVSSQMEVRSQLQPDLESALRQLDRIDSENHPEIDRNRWYFLDKDLEAAARWVFSAEVRVAIENFLVRLPKVARPGSSLSPEKQKTIESELRELEKQVELARLEPEMLRRAMQAYLKLLFPGKNFLCWQKNPWDNLLKNQLPPSSAQECRKIRVVMGRNEYESSSLVLTNLSEKELVFDLSVKNAKFPIGLRQAMWVTSSVGKQVNDALPLIEGPVAIPSGESREIWLTFHSTNVAAGDYRSNLAIDSQGGLPFRIELEANIHPVRFPEDLPVYTFYWDYVIPEWVGPDLAKALVQDMKVHYVNTPIVHPWALRIQLNPDGTLKNDYKTLDQVLDNYQVLKPKCVLLNFGAENYWMTMPGFPDEKWKALFRSWLTDLVGHLKARGLGYDQFAMYPCDESLRPAVLQLVKLIKEVDPKLMVYVNNTGESQEEVRNIAPYVDIWCPQAAFYHNLYKDATPDQLAVIKLGDQLLKKSGRFFWTYANPPGDQPEVAPPYRDYRVAVWRAWQAGMGGFGYWIYCYKTHWNSYQYPDGPNWSVVYLAKAEDAPPGISPKELVVPGKRWEATREGVEDYVYLQMLQQAIQAPDKNVAEDVIAAARKALVEWPEKVLKDENNWTIANAAKEEILKAIASLKREP